MRYRNSEGKSVFIDSGVRHNPLPTTERGKRRMAARGGIHPVTTPEKYGRKK
jgi:hypothetical protein